jgi:hypothetical protein
MRMMTPDDIETAVGRSAYQQHCTTWNQWELGAVLCWRTVFPESHTSSTHFHCLQRLMVTVWTEPVPLSVLVYYINIQTKALAVITSRGNCRNITYISHTLSSNNCHQNLRVIRNKTICLYVWGYPLQSAVTEQQNSQENIRLMYFHWYQSVDLYKNVFFLSYRFNETCALLRYVQLWEQWSYIIIYLQTAIH